MKKEYSVFIKLFNGKFQQVSNNLTLEKAKEYKESLNALGSDDELEIFKMIQSKGSIHEVKNNGRM